MVGSQALEYFNSTVNTDSMEEALQGWEHVVKSLQQVKATLTRLASLKGQQWLPLKKPNRRGIDDK